MGEKEDNEMTEKQDSDRVCPYAFRIEQLNQNTHEYDTDSREVFHGHTLIEVQRFMPCQREKCGTWHRGRCRRK